MTNFKIDIQDLKQRAKKYNEDGFKYENSDVGLSIKAHLETHPLFLNFHISNMTLNEYILFYMFKYAAYAKSYKFESKVKLLFFQISELTYDDIYFEISIDALNYEPICETR